MDTKRRLRMKIAGRFIDLLGHQMYGGAVPAVAEFVANAWDADSPRVDVTVPEDPTVPSAEIIVRDFGEGMTFDELNEYYLTIGYERRKDRGETTESGRLVMGRKGIGKLAGFGIAEDMKPDVVVMMDADEQHNPEDIPRLVEAILQYEADMVVGLRYVARAGMG